MSQAARRLGDSVKTSNTHPGSLGGSLFSDWTRQSLYHSGRFSNHTSWIIRKPCNDAWERRGESCLSTTERPGQPQLVLSNFWRWDKRRIFSGSTGKHWRFRHGMARYPQPKSATDGGFEPGCSTSGSPRGLVLHELRTGRHLMPNSQHNHAALARRSIPWSLRGNAPTSACSNIFAQNGVRAEITGRQGWNLRQQETLSSGEANPWSWR